MASCFGCRVHGIELSPRRCEDANRLTERVGLTALVSVECGDMLAVDLPRRAFDVVYGQGAWIHVADLAALFRRIAAALAPGGRVAFEEGCLQFHASRRSVNTASAEQVRQPVYSDAIGYWKHYESQLTDLKRILEPVL